MILFPKFQYQNKITLVLSKTHGVIQGHLGPLAFLFLEPWKNVSANQKFSGTHKNNYLVIAV